MAVTRAAVASAVLALVGVAGVSGCTSDAQPSPMPTPSSSGSTSPTATPTPPSLPAEASGTSPAAAKAFVRHWIAAMNYAMDTGDVTPIAALSDPDCISCRETTARIEKVYSAGGAIESKGWHVINVALLPNQPRDRPILDLSIRMSPQTVMESPDADAKRFEGGRLPMTFYVKRSGDSWVVTRLARSA